MSANESLEEVQLGGDGSSANHNRTESESATSPRVSTVDGHEAQDGQHKRAPSYNGDGTDYQAPGMDAHHWVKTWPGLLSWDEERGEESEGCPLNM